MSEWGFWRRLYCQNILLLESFVPSAHFRGHWSVDVFCDVLEAFDR